MPSTNERYKNLEIWKMAHSFALDVYKDNKAFPKDESFGLTAQIRRAAVSVPTNIVEGYSRKGDKELARFVDIALGSLAEARYLLSLSKDLGYLTEVQLSALDERARELGRKSWRFYEKVRQPRQTQKARKRTH